MQNTNCPNCGAPLDKTAARNGYVTCEYCGTTVQAGSGEEQLQQFAADFIEDTYRDVLRGRNFTTVFFILFFAVFAIALLFILFSFFRISRFALPFM